MAAQYAAPLPHLGLLGADPVLTAEQGTYTVTGQDATLQGGVRWGPASLPHIGSILQAQAVQYTLAADYGTYTVTGQDAGSLRTYAVAANFGEYVLSGQAGILYAPGAQGGDAGPLPHIGLMLAPDTTAYTLTCDTGIYFVFGSDALADFEVTAEQGSYTVTGQDATLLKTTIMQAETGTYTVSGQDALFEIGGTDRVMPAEYGTYAITGNDATLAPAYALSCEHGFYALLGQAASLVYAPPATYSLLCEAGSYTHTGNDANLDARRLYAEYGTYEVSGFSVRGLPRSNAAGRSSPWKRPRKKYTVEIDGEVFTVESREEAAALLAKAREAAEEAAATAIDRATKAEKRPTRKVLADARKSLQAPGITASGDLANDAAAMQQEIAGLYRSALTTVEIAALMRREEEDEETALLMLL
jgi:hypothetical protein